MCPSRSLLLFFVLGLLIFVNESEASWEEWWTYDGISGPSFWGLINPQWSLCSKGRRQSPINIEPDKLLFDPHLRPVHVDKHKVSGHLHNTGQFLVFRADKEAKIRVNITGGPLAYHYQFEEIYIHYGLDDNHGSEHRVDDYAFPAEIQVYGFNAELYHNISEAQHKSQGLVAISLMVQLGETLNPELRIITSVFSKVLHRGDTAQVSYLSLRSLLPDTNGYMTYEGSTTHPGCWETAVWLILNKPIYITAQELYALRKLMQGPASAPKAPLGNNSRPLQDLHHRTIRTNINFRKLPKAPGVSLLAKNEIFFGATAMERKEHERRKEIKKEKKRKRKGKNDEKGRCPTTKMDLKGLSQGLSTNLHYFLFFFFSYIKRISSTIAQLISLYKGENSDGPRVN